MANIIPFNKPRKTKAPPFSSYIDGTKRSSKEKFDHAEKLPYELFWEALVRDAPDQIPAILSYEVYMSDVSRSVLIASDFGHKELALEILELVKRYVETGVTPQLSHFSPPARGFVYAAPDTYLSYVHACYP
jgi:hypothetical protein